MPHDYATTLNKDHGRIERRECWTISDPACLEYLSTGQDGLGGQGGGPAGDAGRDHGATPAIRFLANVQAGAATQEIENPSPLFW